MVIKYFCDSCNNELDNKKDFYNSDVFGEQTRFRLKLIDGKNGKKDKIKTLCHKCYLKFKTRID